MGYSYWLTAWVLLYAPCNRQDSTCLDRCYTCRGALDETRNSHGVHHEGPIRRPIAPRAIVLPLSYISLLFKFEWDKSTNVWHPIALWLLNQCSLVGLFNKTNFVLLRHLDERERDVDPWWERSLMVRWVVGSILHGVDPLSYISFQPVLHDWCNKGRGMCKIILAANQKE